MTHSQPSKNKLTESKLSDLILDITDAAYKGIPAKVLDILDDARREELMYDLSEAMEEVLRDHFSMEEEEFSAWPALDSAK